MKKALFSFAILTLSLTAAAQSRPNRQVNPAEQEAAIEAKKQYIGGVSPDATTACSFTFTSGTGNKFLKFCVTKNGNITQFQSPSGQEYIATSPAGEGYAFCDFDSQTQYYDYAGYGDSGNWQAPVTKSSSATQVKIARTTSDGMYTLTQTITQNAGLALAQISMALKNNTTATHHIGLLRYADVDASFATNSFDYTSRTAFGYNELEYGLQLQHVSGAFLNGGFSQNIPGGPNSCQIFSNVPGTFETNIDGSIFIQYDMMLKKGATGTVVDTYKSF